MILVDSNVWLDAADRDAHHHEACASLLRNHRARLVTTALVVGEAARLVRFKLGAEAEVAFLHLVIDTAIKVEDLSKVDWVRALALTEGYVDNPLGLVDASIVAIAERLAITDIATMNGRDFYTVSPAHSPAFTLLPEGIARPPRTRQR